MIAWRICRAPYADLSGAGARLYGGRWNARGRALIYAAETAALAVLEVRVHLDLPPELLPEDYLLVAIDCDALEIETAATLPDDPVAFGDRWLAEARTPILRVPSFIVPESANLLINPAHPRAAALAIASTRPFRFDERLWPAAAED
ncbi:RES family NAD+ phosphorylase [Kaistia dalseonensis]|uniref:RES domain-containing protein n=1 Tax=Kaistia dalseonensis TaxID=410840 RepID=A0ABU0H158_9HYPH|nr:RES family NAD+ phosphorylase [Kaistia dalseonensis]MCX5493484.1 RES family NAD+ phosphorylase [Kaistia dalseonensis]MDQ0436044.1 RES domain-containing protein [Kaistia dalseonensis]